MYLSATLKFVSTFFPLERRGALPVREHQGESRGVANSTRPITISRATRLREIVRDSSRTVLAVRNLFGPSGLKEELEQLKVDNHLALAHKVPEYTDHWFWSKSR